MDAERISDPLWTPWPTTYTYPPGAAPYWASSFVGANEPGPSTSPRLPVSGEQLSQESEQQVRLRVYLRK